MSGKVEAARDIIGHGVHQSGVVEHGRGELVYPVVGGSDSEKVGHDVVDGGGLAEGPCNCWGVVANGCWCPSGRGGADGSADFLI